MLVAMTASAAPIVFTLGDHPDSSLVSQTPYGLRLDSQAPAGAGPTWSVGPNLGGSGGPVTLAWDTTNLAAGALISGTLFRNDDNTLWTVSYQLTGLTGLGGGGFTATAGNGTLTPNAGGSAIALTGKQGGSGLAFVFDNTGFRLPGNTGWAGRGWLDPSRVCCDDWLVTATPGPPPGGSDIPEPGTISLMLIGLGMLIGGRKLRKRNS